MDVFELSSEEIFVLRGLDSLSSDLKHTYDLKMFTRNEILNRLETLSLPLMAIDDFNEALLSLRQKGLLSHKHNQEPLASLFALKKSALEQVQDILNPRFKPEARRRISLIAYKPPPSL